MAKEKIITKFGKKVIVRKHPTEDCNVCIFNNKECKNSNKEINDCEVKIGKLFYYDLYNKPIVRLDVAKKRITELEEQIKQEQDKYIKLQDNNILLEQKLALSEQGIKNLQKLNDSEMKRNKEFEERYNKLLSFTEKQGKKLHFALGLIQCSIMTEKED